MFRLGHLEPKIKVKAVKDWVIFVPTDDPS